METSPEKVMALAHDEIAVGIAVLEIMREVLVPCCDSDIPADRRPGFVCPALKFETS
jgi:hypothetical protein